MSRRLHIVLFGASGFTGKQCIGEIHRLSKLKGRSLTWGIAGRSEVKLKQTLSEYERKTGEDLSSIPIIKADVNDYSSLKHMTGHAKSIINCCGPYRLFGEPVVKACMETGTHQVDVTGEPQYMENLQLKYHRIAQEKGIYLISPCGLDSLPADLGVIFLQKTFKGTLNSVETYAQLFKNCPGSAINYATWESAIYGMAHVEELRVVRRKLYPTRLPTFKPRLKIRPTLHKSDLIDAWCIPFLGSDRSVILRSQRYLYEQQNLRPIQAQTYIGLNSLQNAVLALFLESTFAQLSKYAFGRKILLKYPELFSAGMFSRDNPTAQNSEPKFAITFRGEGWCEKLPSDEYKVPADKTIVVRVSSDKSIYAATSSAVTLATIVLLTETDKLPKGGGVYSPGAAFANTSLIQQLQESGIIFEIVSK